jgi:hypothetical protein
MPLLPSGPSWQVTRRTLLRGPHYRWKFTGTLLRNGGLGWRRGTALLVGGSRDRSPVTGDFFRGIRQLHVPWGRLSL